MTSEPKSKWLHVRLSEVEHAELRKLFSTTMERKLSEYVRKAIFQKPLVKGYRNQSMDDFMAVLVKMKAELGRIGNNLNQVTKRLYLYPHSDDAVRLLEGFKSDQSELETLMKTLQVLIIENMGKW